MYLFFDTETTGLPLDWSAPETDVRNWPRLVQIAWIIADKNEVVSESVVHLIKPIGFTIPQDPSLRHGITTEKALAEGVDLLPVLEKFRTALGTCRHVVAHNIGFDRPIISAEFIRAGLEPPLKGKSLQCTMMKSIDYCRIPGKFKNKFKWPTLQELHSKLFGLEFEGSHDAGSDCHACMKCYFKLRSLGVIR